MSSTIQQRAILNDTSIKEETPILRSLLLMDGLLDRARLQTVAEYMLMLPPRTPRPLFPLEKWAHAYLDLYGPTEDEGTPIYDELWAERTKACTSILYKGSHGVHCLKNGPHGYHSNFLAGSVWHSSDPGVSN